MTRPACWVGSRDERRPGCGGCYLSALVRRDGGQACLERSRFLTESGTNPTRIDFDDGKRDRLRRTVLVRAANQPVRIAIPVGHRFENRG